MSCSFLPAMFQGQVQIDHPIQLTGAPGNRKVENLELPVAGSDAANKEYVDQQVSLIGGAASDMQYALSTSTSAIAVPLFGSSENNPIFIRSTFASGTPNVISYLVNGAPSGVYVQLSPGTVTPNSQSRLVFYVDGSALPGVYPITITGQGGASTEVVVINLTVQIPKRVFVSSSGINGNMGGVAGANAHCQNAASAANLSGTFKAWISTGSQSPSTTFTQSSSPYVLVNNTIVAFNWADLIDGELANPINLNEYGNNVGSVKVWTQAYANGTYDTGNCTAQCANWTSSSASSYGRWGVSSSTTSTWSSAGDGSGNGACGTGPWECNQCSCSNRLYCFEQ